jgi:hypothetical protein
MNKIYSHLNNIISTNYGISGMYVHVLHAKLGNKKENVGAETSCDQESRFIQTLSTLHMVSERVNT